MIDLPEHPAPQSAEAALIDFGAFLTPALGGPVQRVERMGNRWRYSAVLPPLPGKQLGRQWLSALIRGKQEGARTELHQQGFDPGQPGLPTVNGASQAGRSLIITGARADYIVRDGQFFSVLTGGKHYLYMNIGEKILNASGAGTLAIEPMLRVSPTNGAQVHLAKPLIEGFIMGDEMAWSLSVEHLLGLSFNLIESE